ncbi:MAG TPA: endolytic transglycosylase MltG [Actinomycetota bacterium]
MKLTRRGRIVLLLGAFVLTLLVGFNLFMHSIGVYGESAPASDRVTIDIPEGTGTAEIGDLLTREGVIKSSLGWRIAVFLHSGNELIQAGTYQLATGLTAPDALDALLERPPKEEFTRVTFPEGSWLTDFAAALDSDTHIDGDAFLELATSGKVRSKYQPDGIETLEGLLFPSTYEVIERDSARTVLNRLVEEFEKQAAGLDFARVESTGVSAYEAITIASMIEAEAELDEERPMIARVIYNRLQEGMQLGIDATILYALGEHKTTLSSEDLAIDSPYNTREVTGLPPTPIGAPGVKSLEAALNPADGEWLYYVLADCEGHHAFSETYEEFLENKAAYQALTC